MASAVILPVPKGWRLVEEFGEGGRYVQKAGQLQVILSLPERAWNDGKAWWHLSISHFTGRSLTYDELRDAKRDFLGNRYAAMVFPPEEHYVSKVGSNPNVLHLWANG